MWLYIRYSVLQSDPKIKYRNFMGRNFAEPDKYCIGFFDPSGRFCIIDTRENDYHAAGCVHFLNGGSAGVLRELRNDLLDRVPRL